MKVLLYFENEQSLRKSGIGRALKHQIKACESAGIEYTLNPKDDYDIAHINTYFTKSYQILKKCKKKGIPVIVHGHSTFEDFRDSFACWKLMSVYYYSRLRKMYGNADVIITPTNYSKELIESYGYNKKVFALSNGIDLNDYQYNKEKVDHFREYFNIQPNQKVVIGIGLPFKRKGLHDFFEVARRMPDVKFIWFGHLQSILVSHFIKKAIKNKPDNAIMAGYFADVKSVLWAADAIFFPTYEETEGIVSLEALATKCPLVIRDIGVYSDWLHNNVDCYKGKNNDEFVEILTRVINNKDEKVVDAGFEVVKERSIDKVGKEIKSLYERTKNAYFIPDKKKKTKGEKLGGEVLRFVAVGIISTLIDFGVSSLVGLLLNLGFGLPKESLWYSAITISIGFIVSVIANYVLSALWVYRNVDKKVNKKSPKNIVLFVFFSLIGLLMGVGIMYGGNAIVHATTSITASIESWMDFANFDFWLFFFFTLFFGVKTLLVMFWNYITRKLFIFKAPIQNRIRDDI